MDGLVGDHKFHHPVPPWSPELLRLPLMHKTPLHWPHSVRVQGTGANRDLLFSDGPENEDSDCYQSRVRFSVLHANRKNKASSPIEGNFHVASEDISYLVNLDVQQLLNNVSLSSPSSVLVLLILTLKRHRKGQRMTEDEEDMRDNVIKYNDEGGGEQDTQAYDMSALRNLYDFPEAKSCDSSADVRSLPQWVQVTRVSGSGSNSGGGAEAMAAADFSLFKGYIRKKVEQADADLSVPPYDSFQTYAFEGSSSPALSLSSIHTLSTTSEQDFSYLSDWGPRFRQLAGYYAPGNLDEEGS